MALSRNARRQHRKARLRAKAERIAKGHLAALADERQRIVQANMASRPERNFYPQSCLANIKALSHRGYVCHNQKVPRSNGEARDKAIRVVV